ncbi:hypothetical protein VSO92_05070 [Myroides pelagicus]|uniref:hypothetical protein n=1 Tax=Myroides pelagicus TaxID=270914 RepID=UPI002DB6FF8F|nr:hypothetical protein [Myroides pelagicus]MEC4113478.1 hypothetical protein [Myroides pelagicus]
MKYYLVHLALSCTPLYLAQAQDSLAIHSIEEVIIQAKLPERSFSSKMPLTSLETPQSYDLIQSSTLEKQVTTNLKDALKNATGIARAWESTGVGVMGGRILYSKRLCPST